MTFDIVLAGVGGQGVLLVCNALAEAGLRHGLTVKQGEIHGMSQRGGSVQAHLRLANGPVASALVPAGAASLVLATEPLEGLRVVRYLGPDGILVTSRCTRDEVAGYPDDASLDALLARLPRVVTVDADALAREAGSVKAANVVVLGAALPWLPLPADRVERVVLEAVEPLGARLVEVNRKALGLGRRAAEEAGLADHLPEPAGDARS